MHYGTQIGKSQLKWKGVLILAPMGQSVHAIADGRVMFARWLLGYGLLLIIDHGNGFMSLYGRLNQINTKVGENVRQGEVIASVGNSGGFKESALYYSLRHNSKAINPKNLSHYF